MVEFTPPWVIFGRLYSTLPEQAALWFFILLTPICAYAAWYDMAHLKIKNELVLLMLALFVITGPLLLPLNLYLWQLGFAACVLIATFFLNLIGAMGGGDSKFIAAAAPFVMPGDWRLILLLACACLMGGIIAHRTARALGGKRLTPTWKSWDSGDRYPAALSLSAILVSYLAISAF